MYSAVVVVLIVEYYTWIAQFLGCVSFLNNNFKKITSGTSNFRCAIQDTGIK